MAQTVKAVAAQTVEAQRQYLVPNECGPLADLIFKAFEDGNENDEIDCLVTDLEASLEFLQEIPDGAKFSDFDLSDFGWNDKSRKIIDRVNKARAKK